MNKQIKKKWIKALRSGKYEQGEERLKTGNSFCCLGVLCDLSRKDGIGEWQGKIFKSKNSCSSGELPDDVRLWAELGDEDPFIGGWDHLSRLNDNGWTFKAIASLIETEL